MTKLKPYIIETKNYVFTYHGGGCNVDNLKNVKRSTVNSFSKSSQRRLVTYLASVQKFTPTILFRFEFAVNPGIDESIQEIKKVLKKITNKFCKDKKSKLPLFIWKKNLEGDLLYFEILSNFTCKLQNEALAFMLDIFWKEYNKDNKVTFEYVTDENKNEVLYNFENYRSDCKSETSTGRWWGVINKTQYTCSPLERVEDTLENIKEKEACLQQNENIRNCYKK